MFFLSGTGALVFENVWFSQAGLIVGNSVWSAALVIAAFMAGLALGNALAMPLARRMRNLVRGYGMLEMVAACSGILLVIGFPFLPEVFRPLLARFLDDPWALAAVRPGIAFVLMVVPAAALGSTLPLLARPVEAVTGNYGLALGRLYAVNTLGAVAGTLLAELVLVPAFGLRGSGMIAGACNLCAALIALRIARRPEFEAPRPVAPALAAAFPLDGRRIVAAAFLAGAILLALEVIWFRFLLLFLIGTTLVFALMLAVCLAGIGAGGMLASRWARRGWSPARVARFAAAGGAIGVVAGYAGFHALGLMLGALQAGPLPMTLLFSIFLMAPVSVFSGVLFTALGDLLRVRMSDAASTTGVLVLANTLGAMAGALLAAFLLLPGWGIEIAFFVLALSYWATALVIPVRGERWTWGVAPALAAALMLALFPFGRMIESHHQVVQARYGERLVEAREGIVETAFYLSHEFLGEPLFYRLATNGYSMSATAILAQRYMKMFAYLPAAFHPKIERALLICFGVGSTLSALTDLPAVSEIDVVDVSRDILEMSVIPYPDPSSHPLLDARVKVRIEDGRFFLQHSERRYDLITGEPPPPKIAGMASLYSREYFRLMRNRLNPGGLATYWLPVHELRESDALAVIGAFCDVFEDCSLWSGARLEWVLMGSEGGIRPVTGEAFARLWADPKAGRGLRGIGIDSPQQLLAEFLADATVLRQLAGHTPPLVDDFPRRITPAISAKRLEPLFAWLLHAERGRGRLEASAWMAGILPPAVIARSREQFRQRGMYDAALHPEMREAGYSLWSDLAALIRDTSLVTWPRWMLGSELRKAEIAARRNPADPVAAEHLAIDALASRRQPAGPMDAQAFAALTPNGQVVEIFRRCLAGQFAEARSLMARIPEERRAQEPYRPFLAWTPANCGAG